MFPKTIDGATVLYHTDKGDFGTHRFDASIERAVYLAIAVYEGDAGYYRFSCDENYEVITDSYADTLEQCMDVGLGNVLWIKI